MATKPAPVKAAPTTLPVVKDRLSSAELAQSYGYVTALINSSPELKNLFAAAYGSPTTGQWTAARFQAAIQNSNWYKQHSDQWRKTELIRTGDPQTFAASVNAAAQDVIRLASQMGATVTDAQAHQLGQMFYQGNYNASQQQQAIGQYLTNTTSTDSATNPMTGTVATTAAALKQYAGQMGVTMNNSWYDSAEKSVAMGLSDAQAWQDAIKQTAKSQYAPFATQIDQGQTVANLASAYTSKMASTLEMDPNQITLQDPTIQKALTGIVDPKTGQPQVQSLWSFDQSLRQDPRWQTTQNANQLANDTAMNVLQTFGFS